MAREKAVGPSSFRLLTDQALGDEGGERGDGLGFASYATVIANAAAGTPGPFTVGVFGEWGTGKTSLMRMIQQRLERDQIVTVWFNAWQYEMEANPIVPLVGTIIEEIERNQCFRATLSDAGSGLIRSLRAIAYGFSASAEIEMPGFAKVEAAFVAKDMIDREAAITADPLIERSLYYHAFESLTKVRLPEHARVVVLIDDLDRCFPDKAIRLLESIKLVLAQRGFIFVIGVSRRVIEGYLEHRYQTQYGLDAFEGASYLDKMVQLAFSIPPHAGRMNDLADQLIAGVDTSQREQVASVVPLIAQHLGGNPRSLVRFVNNLLIDVEIAKLTLKTEVPLEFFAITRCLQLRWRIFYDSVVLDRAVANMVADASADDLEGRSAEGQGAAARASQQLLLNPDLAALVGTEPCQRWLRQHSNREHAVLFLRTTLRNSDRNAFSASQRVMTFVVAADEQYERMVVNALRTIETDFSRSHRTFHLTDLSDFSDAEASKVIVRVGLSAQDPLAERRIGSELDKGVRVINVPVPASDENARRIALNVFEELFGEQRYVED